VFNYLSTGKILPFYLYRFIESDRRKPRVFVMDNKTPYLSRVSGKRLLIFRYSFSKVGIPLLSAEYTDCKCKHNIMMLVYKYLEACNTCENVILSMEYLLHYSV
jgi:hypothetical protein